MQEQFNLNILNNLTFWENTWLERTTDQIISQKILFQHAEVLNVSRNVGD
jgi:hypothetical protein